MTNMKALTLHNGRLQYRIDYPQPIPQPGEVLIQVRLAGICTTDLEMVKGYVPGFEGVLGHEFVGIVVDGVDREWHGCRVVGAINIGCQQCPTCQRSGPEHCPNRCALGIHNKDGAFAEFLTLPLENLHIVPDNVPDEAAVFTEPLAAALRILEQVKITPSAQTAIIGPGRLGLLAAQVLALGGTAVTVLGRSTGSLTLPAKLRLNTALVNDIPDNSFDLIVEATGNEDGFGQAVRLVRPLGTIILKSTYATKANLDLTPIVVDEITVVGSRCGPFPPALRLLAEDQLDVFSLIDAHYPPHRWSGSIRPCRPAKYTKNHDKARVIRNPYTEFSSLLTVNGLRSTYHTSRFPSKIPCIQS